MLKQLSDLKKGHFIISLDFELYWGVRDIQSIQTYGKNILGVHQAIPAMLALFDSHDIKATFATVGFLFHSDKKELTESIPHVLPEYADSNLSPFTNQFEKISDDGSDKDYYFAPQLIDLIIKSRHHEIGTHTYSHYYCLEPGQTHETFQCDIKKAIDLAARKNIQITSLVFPRNQFNEEYLKVCKEMGIICYRGNEPFWFYKADAFSKESKLKRAFRLLDAYLPLSGNNGFEIKGHQNIPVNIPSSRFLRPYNPRLALLDKLKIRRICKGMTDAAKNGKGYHLWWHPHNFGIYQQENLAMLKQILKHYQYLHKQFGFESITMSDLAKKILHEAI